MKKNIMTNTKNSFKFKKKKSNIKLKTPKDTRKVINKLFDLVIYIIMLYYMMISSLILINMVFNSAAGDFRVFQFIMYLLVLAVGSYNIVAPSYKKIMATLALIVLMF
jgi:hypothetical protein